MIVRILILFLLLAAGCISGKAPGETDRSDPVLESGDFVKMDFTERIRDTGEVFYTTYANATSDSQYEPLEFTLGEGQIPPALEAGVIGMKIGDEKNITVTPEEGYGEWFPENVKAMPRIVVLPKLTDMPLSTFRAIAGKEPEMNETIQLNHNWTGRVVNISTPNMTLLIEPGDNTAINTEYGPAVVTLNDTHIITSLTPELGTVITIAFDEGVISDINETDFTIDFNHPLAGKTLVFEVTVRDIIKAEQVLAQKIVWTDHETGLKIAKNEKRPALIFLYLEGCQACEILDTLTLSNPQVTELKDKFVWIKVDVAANLHVSEEYEAGSYPTIVLLNRAGEVSNKITGYITPAELKKEMDACLAD
jgi:FKBP-type peptidyl-prolyl cis-trans isomerase 2